MRKLQASDNVVYRTLQTPKISGISGIIPEFFRKNSGKFPTFYFSGKVTTLVTDTLNKLSHKLGETISLSNMH